MTAYSYITTAIKDRIEQLPATNIEGYVTKVVGAVIYATLVNARLGDICKVKKNVSTDTHPSSQKDFIWAEIVGFNESEVVLAPLSRMEGITQKAKVISTGSCHRIGVGDSLLGRVINGLGEPVDAHQKGMVNTRESCSVNGEPPDPLMRQPIQKQLFVGVKAIDGLLSIGEGQRLGIFAGAGVGKTTLLGALARHADVDVVVLALIGERGREVRDFIDQQLGEDGMKKAVVVVSTADQPVMQRVRSLYTATTVAEYFRDQNKRVLLLVDSLTRFARALREVGLSAGEIPARRGYPPSVFSTLPQLLERTGQSVRGSITAVYSVLMEGDDVNEPVADEARSLLDGHIVFSRELAAAGHYPAIDVLASTSRIMNQVVDSRRLSLAIKARGVIAKYKEIELLVKMGEFKEGVDSDADVALACFPRLQQWLQQNTLDKCFDNEAIRELEGLLDVVTTA